MGSEQWTSQDVDRWRRLGATGWATGLLAGVWFAGHAAFFFAGPPPPSEPALMWWVTLAFTGLVLIPLRGVLVVVLAVVLAAVEASLVRSRDGARAAYGRRSRERSGGLRIARTWYVRYARTQQRRYAASRAHMQVPLPSTRSVRPFSA